MFCECTVVHSTGILHHITPNTHTFVYRVKLIIVDGDKLMSKNLLLYADKLFRATAIILKIFTWLWLLKLLICQDQQEEPGCQVLRWLWTYMTMNKHDYEQAWL